MPKLISRLVRRLNRNQSPDRLHIYSPKRKTRPKSLFSGRPPPTNWVGPRSQSVLQDDANPLTQRRLFLPHKRLPPRVSRSQPVLPRVSSTFDDDGPREMTEEERHWWANPYCAQRFKKWTNEDTNMRMLASPLRKCVLTGVTLPSDLLIRVTPRRVSPSQGPSSKGHRLSTVLLGDGQEHPKFRSIRDRRGFYVLCRADVFDRFGIQSTWRKYLRDNPTIDPPSITAQIGHLLRLRVIQEIELLAARLQARLQDACETPIIRRFTRAELSTLRVTGALPYDDVSAVIVLPPLNKDPETKSRPSANATPLPDSTTTQLIGSSTTKLPLSELLRPGPAEDGDDLPLEVQPRRTPLYNGAALFPTREQRAALYDKLSDLLAIERRARFSERGRNLQGSKYEGRAPARGDAKASHAFMIRSGASTASRGDTVPVAIALWRLRMWEGSAWRDNVGTWLDIA